LAAPWTLAAAQLGVGVVYSVLLWTTGGLPRPRVTWDMIFLCLPLALFRAMSHATSVLASAAGAVSVAQIVKSAEPVFASLVSAIHAPPEYKPCVAYGMLVPIVMGVALATYQGGGMHSTTVAWASLSNLAGAIKSKLGKTVTHKLHAEMDARNVYAILNVLSFVLVVPCMWWEGDSLARNVPVVLESQQGWTLVLYVVLGGLGNYLYNECAFLVTAAVGAVTSSVLNTTKRLVVIAVSALVFQEALSGHALTGAALALMGTLGYSLASKKQLPKCGNRRQQRWFVVIVAVALLSCFQINSLSDHQVMASISSPPPPAIVVEAPTTPCRIASSIADLEICHAVPKHLNFGDELGPAVVHHLLQREFGNCTLPPVRNVVGRLKQARPPCLWTVGSILHHTRDGDHVWGSGVNPHWQQTKTIANVTVHAVRGPQTQAYLGNSSIPMGDPGFLIPLLFPTTCTKQYDHCYVPHYHDLDTTETQALRQDGVHIISPQDHWQPVLDELCTCRRVASSSLHGLIVADALGLDWLWVQSTTSATSQTEGTFKYLDYFESTGRYHTTPATNVSTLYDDEAYTAAYIDASVWARRLETSFPWHLFRRIDEEAVVEIE